MYRMFAALTVVAGLVMVPAPRAWAAEDDKAPSTEKQPREPDVMYVPTPDEVVAKMLDLVKLKKGEVLYDLGCGDGRIVVAAAKRGAKATGFEIHPDRLKMSRENVKKNKVEKNAKIVDQDIFTLDLSKANVITLYLLPSLNVKLIPQLEKLKPGSRIVSHDFDMEGVKPDKVVEVTSKNGDVSHTVYLWTTPLKKEGKEKEKEKEKDEDK